MTDHIKKLRELNSVKKRRQAVESALGISLENVSYYPKDLDQAQYQNCENMIGAVSVPLGIAGPLFIKEMGNVLLPLATTEGALVASVNRGCKAITKSGGADTFAEVIGVSRGPVFKTAGLKESLNLKSWVLAHKSKLNGIAQKTSNHISLTSLFVKVVGRNVFIRMDFDTSAAMGMNMATIASDAIVKYIKDQTGARCVALAGNFDVDKKPAWLNAILGRGKAVWAEAVISKDVLKNVLKTNAYAVHEVAITKCLIGSAVSGSMGYNSHFANMIAALFIATGQDAAHTVEGSLGLTTTELVGDDLAISVYLPSLEVGVIGGGTVLPSQKECLTMMGIDKNNDESVLRLARIISGAVLAGELSLLASLSQGTLATSHKILARSTRNQP